VVTKRTDGGAAHEFVMAGHSGSTFGRPEYKLVPAIHVFLTSVNQDVDARDKRGHDG